MKKLLKAMRNWRSNIDFISSYLMSLVQILSNGTCVLIVTSVSGLDVYGGLLLLRSIGGILVGFLSFRTSEVIVKFSSGGNDLLYNIKNTLGISLILDSLLVICILSISHEITFFLNLFNYTGSILASDFQLYLIAIAVSVYLSSMFGVFQSIYSVYLINIIKIVQSILFVVFLIFYSLFFELTLNSIVLSVFYSNVFTVITCVLVLLIRLRRVNFLKRIYSWNNLLSYLFSTFFSSSLKGVNQNIDVLLVSSVLDETILGLYGIVKQFMLPVQKFIEPYSIVLFPKFVKYYTEHGLNYLKKEVIRENKKQIFRSTAISFCFITLAYIYIHMFLNRSDLSVYIMIVIALDLLIKVNLWWCRPYSNVMKPSLTLIANFVTLSFMSLLLMFSDSVFVKTWLFELICLNSLIMLLGWNLILIGVKK